MSELQGLTRGSFVEPEIQQAARNHGMPLEALRYDITPPGLHYLLTHFDIPEVDVDTWTLQVDGLVERPAGFGLEALRALGWAEATVTMECAGNGRALVDHRPLSQPWLHEAIGTSRWGGVSLAAVLEHAGVSPAATEIVFTGLDRGVDGDIEQQYQRSLPLELALSGEVLVALDMNGASLPPQHGAPARLIVPGWYGMTNVKWLSRITAVDEPFRGYQQEVAYRIRRDADEAGEPITRMLPRSLMIPPGLPGFPTRDRFVTGPCVLHGRAWSGQAPIASVDVSVDGGDSWELAELDRGSGDGHIRWCGWTYRWDSPSPGSHELMSRATDTAGNVQPDDPSWNLGGYVNNSIQRVAVTVS